MIKSEKGNFLTDGKIDSDIERLTRRQQFQAGVFLPVTDNIGTELNKRRDCYEALNTTFKIFRNLHEKEQEDVTKQAQYLAQSYPKDINEEQFVQHFKMYMKVKK